MSGHYKTKRADVSISRCYNIAMANNPLFKNNLVEVYNKHAQERDTYKKEAWKVEERANFLKLLKSKNKSSLLEIGAGTGQDSKFFQDMGMTVTCIDLSPEMVKFCQQKGLSARVMDMTNLDFPPGSFDAVYALNSLLHIPKADFRTVLENVRKVLKSSGLFYLGVYGSDEEFEGVWEEDTYNPKRFFSFFTDDGIQKSTSEIFELLYFKHIPVEGSRTHFQSLILEKQFP
jgi:SAM-dependent methyltransferase